MGVAHISDEEVIQLLQSVAEQLKTPLSIIIRQTELSELMDTDHLDVGLVRTQATTALTLIESYLLGLQLLREQTQLPLEPVSPSSLLTEVAHELESFAKQYNVILQLHVAGKYGPVMANRRGLKASLLSVGYALLEGRSTDDRRLTLAVHRTPRGIVTGLYGNYPELSSSQWRRALALRGQAQQPFTALCSGSGAGIFVAQTILQSMTAHLRISKYLNHWGLATTLQPSQQLRFV